MENQTNETQEITVENQEDSIETPETESNEVGQEESSVEAPQEAVEAPQEAAEAPQEAAEAPQEAAEAPQEVQPTEDTPETQKPTQRNTDARVKAIISDIQRITMKKNKMSFQDAREGARLCRMGISLAPNSKETWLGKLSEFLRIMDMRSVNGYSIEATEIRKALNL